MREKTMDELINQIITLQEELSRERAKVARLENLMEEMQSEGVSVAQERDRLSAKCAQLGTFMRD